MTWLELEVDALMEYLKQLVFQDSDRRAVLWPVPCVGMEMLSCSS